jgi:hypothetical protein
LAPAERVRGLLRSRWHWLIPVGIAFGLLYPILFSDRSFATDWGNHMWLIHMQGLDIKGLGEPGYYLHSGLGFFYPYFAFYGGTMYAALGLVSLAANPEFAMLVAYAAAIAANFGGWTWIARQAGIDGWWAMLPGALAVTAPYAVTNMYGRGDLPEVIATSTIPLVAASALACVREERLRYWSAAAFVVSVAVLTGTHALTLIWGTTFLLLCAALLVASDWRGARARARRGLRLVWLGALGIGINAWILVPLILYHTRLRERGPDPLGYLNVTDHSQLFSIFRDSAGLNLAATADLNAQLPVLALLWALAFGLVFWPLLNRVHRRLGVGLLAILAAFVALILSPSLIERLPETWRYIQFPYRLVTYADLAAIGLVTLALAAMRRAGAPGRVAVWLLAAVAAFSFVLALRQNSQVRSFLPDRAAALQSPFLPPASWYAPMQFADASAPRVPPTLPGQLRIPIDSGDHDSYTARYPAGPAGTAETNIRTWTYFVSVEGATPIGVTRKGKMVVRLPASERAREVTFSQSWGTGISIGRWISLIAIAEALIASAICGFAWLRGRRGAARRPSSFLGSLPIKGERRLDD